MELEIVKMGINGEGIGYWKNKPVFVAGAYPGEVVEVQMEQQTPKYSIAKRTRLIKASKDRVKSVCQNRQCDGCALRDMRYEAQLRNKRDVFVQSVSKYADIDPKKIQPIVANPHPWQYRNQCKLPVVEIKGKLVNALYASGSNRPIELAHCVIHEEKLEQARLEVLDVLNAYHMKAYDHKTKQGIRYLVMRHLQNAIQLTLVGGDESYPDEMVEALLKIKHMTSIYRSLNTDRHTHEIFGKSCTYLAGETYLEWMMEDMKVRISPQSFFQLNTAQAENMYRLVHQLVPECHTLLEAYSGIGGISMYVHDKAKKIIGVEVIPSAVKNANQNAQRNHLEHVSFVCGDAAIKVKDLCKKEKPEVIIVDPPRAGLDDPMLEVLLNSHTQHIIYVSCNASTLGKNLSVLSQRYDVVSITPVDMFSQTPLCESITVLKRKSGKKH